MGWLKGIFVVGASVAFAVLTPIIVERLLIPNACAYHTAENVPWWIDVFFPLDEMRHPGVGGAFIVLWLAASVGSVFAFWHAANVFEGRAREFWKTK